MLHHLTFCLTYFPSGCPRTPTRPPSTVSILGLAFRCNQPCRTPACQEARGLCETPICLVHWDKRSPRELLEWKDEYKKAQLKRQGWAAASGHSLSAALLQTTFILMRRVWLPCLHTTQRSGTDRCAGAKRKGWDVWQEETETHPCLETLIGCLRLIAAIGSILEKHRSIHTAPVRHSSNLRRWDEWVEVMSCYGPVNPVQQALDERYSCR